MLTPIDRPPTVDLVQAADANQVPVSHPDRSVGRTRICTHVPNVVRSRRASSCRPSHEHCGDDWLPSGAERRVRVRSGSWSHTADAGVMRASCARRIAHDGGVCVRFASYSVHARICAGTAHGCQPSAGDRPTSGRGRPGSGPARPVAPAGGGSRVQHRRADHPRTAEHSPSLGGRHTPCLRRGRQRSGPSGW
jgi:hypothetical protein